MMQERAFLVKYCMVFYKCCSNDAKISFLSKIFAWKTTSKVSNPNNYTAKILRLSSLLDKHYLIIFWPFHGLWDGGNFPKYVSLLSNCMRSVSEKLKLKEEKYASRTLKTRSSSKYFWFGDFRHVAVVDLILLQAWWNESSVHLCF